MPVPVTASPFASVASNQVFRPNEAPASGGTIRAQFNVSIVQASFEVSINSGNEPLALLFKSAIESLNDFLEADFGPNAIQNAVNQDNSPEGTADRIVSLATGFFDAFKEQNPGLGEEDVLQKFLDTIRSGFEQGFQEASDILNGLGVLNGSIADGINRTHELVLQGFADFEAAHSPRSDQAVA